MYCTYIAQEQTVISMIAPNLYFVISYGDILFHLLIFLFAPTFFQERHRGVQQGLGVLT